MTDKSLYSDIRVHRLQTAWIWISAILCSLLILAFNKFWIGAIVCLISWLLFAWIGISLISLLDYNHRMAMKYNIKIENIPFYEKIFNDLMDKESRGIDTLGIPSEIQDVDEWTRFCRWQIEIGLRKSNAPEAANSSKR